MINKTLGDEVLHKRVLRQKNVILQKDFKRYRKIYISKHHQVIYLSRDEAAATASVSDTNKNVYNIRK